MPKRVELVLGERVLALGGTPDRSEGSGVLDLTEEDLALAVALLDGAVRGGRAAVELEVELCSVRRRGER